MLMLSMGLSDVHFQAMRGRSQVHAQHSLIADAYLAMQVAQTFHHVGLQNTSLHSQSDMQVKEGNVCCSKGEKNDIVS